MDTECRKLFSSIVSGFSVVVKSQAILTPDSSLETCFSLKAVSVFVSRTLNIGSDVFGLVLFASLGLVLGLFPSGHSFSRLSFVILSPIYFYVSCLFSVSGTFVLM